MSTIGADTDAGMIDLLGSKLDLAAREAFRRDAEAALSNFQCWARA
jgi:hypothetical protein